MRRPAEQIEGKLPVKQGQEEKEEKGGVPLPEGYGEQSLGSKRPIPLGGGASPSKAKSRRIYATFMLNGGLELDALYRSGPIERRRQTRPNRLPRIAREMALGRPESGC